MSAEVDEHELHPELHRPPKRDPRRQTWDRARAAGVAAGLTEWEARRRAAQECDQP